MSTQNNLSNFGDKANTFYNCSLRRRCWFGFDLGLLLDYYLKTCFYLIV